MKKEIHPENYRLVVFKDVSSDYTFLTRSTAPSKETIKWEDGKEYPLIKTEISHKSHPFYTGKMQYVDTAGRIEKFKKRYERFNKQQKEKEKKKKQKKSKEQPKGKSKKQAKSKKKKSSEKSEAKKSGSKSGKKSKDNKKNKS